MPEVGHRRPATAACEVADDLLDGLIELSFTVQRLVGDVAERHELSVAQLRLLGVLRDCRPRMIDLAGILRLERSSITGLIDRAEKRGLVRRVPVDGDRRCLRVVVTAEGALQAALVRRDVEERLADLVGELHQSGRAELLRSLIDSLVCRL